MRGRGFRAIASLSAIAVLGAAAVGCGGSSNGSKTNAGKSTADAKAGPAAPYDQLRWAFAGGVRKLDYVKSLDVATLAITRLGVEGLMRLDKDGKVQPGLAASAEQRDPTTYVYELRDGVRFWNGAPLRAADVVYSLNRNRAKDAATSSYFKNVKSIAAEGATTVVVKLKTPDATWQYVPTFAGQIVEKKFAVSAGDKLGTPKTLTMGTGPWRITSFNPDTGVELVRNDSWWGGKAPAARISLKFVADASTAALALRSGEIDGMFDPDANAVKRVPNVDLIKAQGTGQFVVSLNTLVKPFSDVHVRKAIAHATNREGIVRSILGGTATVSDTIVPTTLWGNLASQDEVKRAYDTLPKYPYDLEAAKRELARSAFPDGFSTMVPVESSIPTKVKAAQVLASDLAKIGIRLKVKEVPASQWLEILYGPRDKLGMLLSEYGTGYPDPNFYLSVWLDSSAAVENGLNSANFKNNSVDALIQKQLGSTDAATRMKDIVEALRITGEQVPYVPVYSQQELAAVSSKFSYPAFSSTYPMDAWALYISKAT